MSYDPSDFIAGLDELRTMWLERQIHLSGPYDKDWGWLRSDEDLDGFRPSFYLGNRWEPQSNHARLEKAAWTARLREIFKSMDTSLRRIPALNYPEMSWSLDFRQGNGQTDHILTLAGIPFSATHLTSLGTTAHRLRGFASDTETLPDAHDLPLWQVGLIPYRASCPQDVIHIRSAVRREDPEVVHRRDFANILPLDPEPAT
jgi:hypothetical protein